MPYCTQIKKCTAVCTICGKDARYTHKKQQDSNNVIQIGGDELYEPRCQEHYNYMQS